MKANLSEKTLESMSQAVWYNRWTLKKFEVFLSGKILEVGCGTGNFTENLTKYGQVFAIDINKTYLNKLTSKLGESVKVGFGDIEKGKYFFKEQKFNSIVCLNVLEHIKKDKNAMENLYKLLHNNGYLILLVPSHPFLYGQLDKAIGHFRRYKKNNLVQKLNYLKFKIKSARVLNLLGAIGWFIAGRFLKESKVENEKIKIFNFLAPFILPLEDLIEPPFGTSILIIAQKGYE